MDIRKIMIIIKGNDQTEEIENFQKDSDTGCIKIVYVNSDTVYQYKKENVQIYENPKTIDFSDSAIYIDNFPVYQPQCLIDFGEKIRIIGYNGKAQTVNAKSISIIRNGLNSEKAKQCMEYLYEISQYTTDNEDKEAYLKQQMRRLTFIHPESVLSCYLNQQKIEAREPKNETIFPFHFNLSQKSALENALHHSLSVIEGPPGTGKTQTILNIIANLVAIQGKSVAVVSNNNEAVKNIIEKMNKHGYGFIAALLGKTSNQEKFFMNMPDIQIDGWDCEDEFDFLQEQIEYLNSNLNHLLLVDRKRTQLKQELSAWKLEQEHFNLYFERQEIEELTKLPLFRTTPDRIISFLAETSLAKENHQTKNIVYKLKLLLKYGVFDYKKLRKDEVTILLSMQKAFYRKQIDTIESKIIVLEKQLEKVSFDDMIKQHQLLSEKLFRKYLYQRYSAQSQEHFDKKTYKPKFDTFINRFPIILSTTHALLQSIPDNYLLDYVIIDEASQVDLITGILALSCCKNAVIVGDLKQLEQITDKKLESTIMNKPPSEEYNYFQQSILSSVVKLYDEDISRQILREHYRCHPQIIEFCNQKYYAGKLIPYTDFAMSTEPLILYRTVEGNHMRRITTGDRIGRYNQRELDIIKQEILNNPDYQLEPKDVGVISPYRRQADEATILMPNGTESDTVHKYQGREKDVVIMSTVLDDTKDGRISMNFVDDPQMLNVAVSRAIKQFILVTDHDLFFKKGKHIGDLIRYIQYSTLDVGIVDSQVVSVFDLLYQRYSSKLISLKAKMNPHARYQSEEAIRVLLEEILIQPDYEQYSYVHGMLLRNLLNNVELLTPEELSFVNHRASLDFVVFYKHGKTCALVIEVDGVAFHENNPEQLRRDALKDAILVKYKIPILRLPTNGSGEREKIEKALKSS
jgi:hypothetical protein